MSLRNTLRKNLANCYRKLVEAQFGFEIIIQSDSVFYGFPDLNLDPGKNGIRILSPQKIAKYRQSTYVVFSSKNRTLS